MFGCLWEPCVGKTSFARNHTYRDVLIGDMSAPYAALAILVVLWALRSLNLHCVPATRQARHPAVSESHRKNIDADCLLGKLKYVHQMSNKLFLGRGFKSIHFKAGDLWFFLQSRLRLFGCIGLLHNRAQGGQLAPTTEADVKNQDCLSGLVAGSGPSCCVYWRNSVVSRALRPAHGGQWLHRAAAWAESGPGISPN